MGYNYQHFRKNRVVCLINNMLNKWRNCVAKDKAHFLGNAILGLSLLPVLLIVGPNFSWMESLDNTAFDLFQKYETFCFKSVASQNKVKSPSERLAALLSPSSKIPDQENSRLHFIEIREKEFSNLWQSPVITPRQELARIINTVSEKHPLIIFLDVSLDRATVYKDKDFPSVPVDQDGDRVLVKTLQAIRNKPDGPVVILPVALDEEGHRKPTIVDGLVDNTRIFHAITNTIYNDSDKISRHWELYQMADKISGKGSYPVWSVPLLSAAIISGQVEKLNQIGNDIKMHAAQIAAGKKLSDQSAPILLFGRDVNIPFPIGEKIKESDGIKISPPEDRKLTYVQRIRYHLLPEETAYKIRNSADQLFNLPDLTGKIAVIGSTAPESGDIKETPVGKLPGMYVMGNAMNTVLAGIIPITPPVAITVLYVAIVVLLAALLFTIYETMIANMLASIVILIVFTLPGWIFYSKFGWFINIYLPIVIMSVHAFFSDLEITIKNCGKRRKGG